MNKRKPAKLILSKETLRLLNNGDLRETALRDLNLADPKLVQGGGQIDSAWPSCPSVCANCSA